MRGVTRALAVVGLLAIACVLAGGLALRARIRRGFSARDEPSAIEAALARAMRRWAAPPRVRNARSPVEPTPAVLAEARAHWADHCAVCHSNDGSGDTAIGRNLYPRAPDMRREATQKLSDGELYAIIENGICLTGMPAWNAGGAHADDSWKLVAFIRRLPAVTPEELREMERLNPKGPDERKEEQEEDEFLKGDNVQPDAKGDAR